ncbi:MAG: bifunctional DNA primase/polymerase [Planctomycetia bacterium]|nr:bifunctional DNA primase/polymerase [Planctomycetia bacterium]
MGTQTTSSSPAQTARRYAERHWPVFPVSNGPGGRGPKKPARVQPAGASHDLRQVRKWWREAPDAGIGLATGPKSGLMAVIAANQEGRQYLDELQGRFGRFPPTPTVRSEQGTLVYLFALPAAVQFSGWAALKVLPLRLRLAGGWVSLPPSSDDGDGRWAWELRPDDVPVADMPAWLVDWLRDEADPPVARPQSASPRPDPAAKPTGRPESVTPAKNVAATPDRANAATRRAAPRGAVADKAAAADSPKGGTHPAKQSKAAATTPAADHTDTNTDANGAPQQVARPPHGRRQ